jgi:hypothetical protein
MVFKFLYSFSGADMMPIIEMQRFAADQVALSAFDNRMLMSETLLRKQLKGRQESIMAQSHSQDVLTRAQNREESKGSEESQTRTYSIVYYNPESEKTEVITEQAEIKVKDYAKAMIDESMGTGTTMPLYKYIGAPIISREIVPWKLQKILDEREYGTPPTTGSGASVVPVRVIQQSDKEKEVALAREEEIKAAIGEAIIRKERSELQVIDEIILLEEVVALLREGEDIDIILARLPPLSRARYILAMKKKHLSKKKIINMLLRDATFLKKLKKKLELFTLDDLLNMVKILRRK